MVMSLKLRDLLINIANVLNEHDLLNERIKNYLEYCNQYDYIPNKQVIETEIMKIIKHKIVEKNNPK